MLARVNLPRRKRDSKPAFGTYVLTYTDGSTQTVRSDVLQLADYPDVNKAIALNGGTIVAANRTGQTLGGTAGDYGLSLVGSSNYETFHVEDSASIGNFNNSSDRISIPKSAYFDSEGFTDDGGWIINYLATEPPLDDAGQVTVYGVSSDKSVTVTSTNYTTAVYPRAKNALGLFNNTDPKNATSVNLTTRKGDYGVCGTSPTSTLASGAEYYANILVINAYYSDSTVHGTDENNNIYLYGGGDRQIVVGGMGNDSVLIAAGSAMMLDYGIGVTKSGTNGTLANNTSQTLTSAMYAYERFNAGSYQPGHNTIQIRGTVTGVYLLNKTSAVLSKKQNTFTAAITYTHNSGSNEVIVLRDVMKEPTTPSATDSKKVFWTNAVAAAKIWIYEIDSNGNSASVSSDALKAMMHEDTAIPLWAARKVAGLNEAYNSLTPPHYNSRVTERSAAYNVANAPFNTITPATVDDWWYANYVDDSGEGGETTS